MQDRVSLYPGRVKLTPVSGQTNVYDMVRADEPTQEGTALNKANLLTDATAALFGLDSDAVPNDVLIAIKTAIDNQADAIAAGPKIATGSYTGTGTYGSSNPCKLTFDFVPKFVCIRYNGALTGLFACLVYGSNYSSTADHNLYVTWSGNTVKWYEYSNSSAQGQLNQSGKKHYWVAIG